MLIQYTMFIRIAVSTKVIQLGFIFRNRYDTEPQVGCCSRATSCRIIETFAKYAYWKIEQNNVWIHHGNLLKGINSSKPRRGRVVVTWNLQATCFWLLLNSRFFRKHFITTKKLLISIPDVHMPLICFILPSTILVLHCCIKKKNVQRWVFFKAQILLSRYLSNGLRSLPVLPNSLSYEKCYLYLQPKL